MRKKVTRKKATRKRRAKKDNKGLLFLGLGAAFLLFSSFKNKTIAGPTLINQIDKPTGTDEVYSKKGTKLFDINKNVVYTFEDAGLGMTVTGFNNGIFSVVYGDSFQFGLPAFVNVNDVIITDPSEFIK
jgi:hypothetical protein